MSGNTLKIKAIKNIGNASSKKVTITLPKVTAIECGGGTLLKTTSVINADNIKVTSSGGSNMEATVVAKKVEAEASSGSHMLLNGKTEDANLQSSSGGGLNAANLVANFVNAEASSGSNTTVNATKSLNAEASSGSHVFFTKTPEKFTKDESSGGSVSQQ